MKHKLLRIGAFWRNDEDDGLGIMFTSHPENRGSINETAAEIADLVKSLDKAKPMFGFATMTEERIAYLRACAPDKDTLSAGIQIIAAASIQWLEQNGHLKPDDMNGMLYIKDLS